MKKKGKIFILSGPSGSGKTTLYEKVLRNPKLRNCLRRTVSVTTRPARNKEIDGKDYWFVSRRMFLYKIRAQHFLEYAKVFDNYYGTTAKAVHDILNSGKNCLLCIDVQGARIVRQKFPQAIGIFVKTKDLATLQKRLKDRATEDSHTLALRLATAKQELRDIKFYQYVLVNDCLSRAHKELKSILQKELS